MGVPSALFYPTVAFEIGAGLLVILGFKTRIVAILLAVFCVVSALVFHADFGDQMQAINFLKNLSMAGGFLLLAQVGPGRISLDGQQR
jgi:putative oxidoreductase